MQIRLAANLQEESIVDGIGIRAVVWTQGCSHNCKGCQNPATHDTNDGFDIDVDLLIKQIKNLKYHDGITLSGGEPFMQAKQCAYIAASVKDIGLNVWCYTGYTYEQIINSKNKYFLDLLNNIDVLIDGKFELDKLSYNTKFRGSTNQRLIDVKSSLEQNKIITLEEIQEEKKDYIFI